MAPLQPTYTTPSAVSYFRRLCWEGTIPLEIRIDTKELPANSDRGLDAFYIQAPRVGYLPLVLDEVKKFLVDLVFDEAAGRGTGVKEEEWWFEGEGGNAMKWHWPLGLLYDIYTVASSPTPPSLSPSPQTTQPLKLTLHLVSPPSDKLLLSSSLDTCKQSFMSQLKEADFLRWGNTKRVTGLRKQDQDGLWEAVRDHDFESYWRISAKIIPSPSPIPSPASVPPTSPPKNYSQTHLPSRPPSTDPTNQPGDNAYSIRSVPIRLYLPDSGPVLQDLAPPFLEDGLPHTLSHFLTSHLPLLFPPPPPSSSRMMGSRILPPQHAAEQPLAYVLIQGVHVPLEAELAWLGACLAGADGWVCGVIGLR